MADRGRNRITAALAAVPEGLLEPLLDAFERVQVSFVERRWEAAELNGGKLCECIYSILQGLVSGSFATSPSKPANMVSACRDLEHATAFPRSIRIQIPRMLIALYEIRNNRNVGHVGGDVDPNEMDAGIVLAMSKWLMAELIRYFHKLTTSEAADLVDQTVARTTAAVWVFDDVRRVLDTTLSLKAKSLLLIHSSSTEVSEEELCRWVECSSPSVYRRDVLIPMHKAALIDYDKVRRTVRLSPTGIAKAEEIAASLASS